MNPTRLAILGTLSDLHREPLPYDLAALRNLIIELDPEILCAEVTRETWESGDLATAQLEVREALTPAAASTDIVLIPIIPDKKQFMDFSPSSGWRWRTGKTLERVLRWGQRKAGTVEAVNGFLFDSFCHTLCVLTENLWARESREAWEEQNRQIAENILQVTRRDPGRRILVAVQCQRLHRLVPMLRSSLDQVQIVHYQKL